MDTKSILVQLKAERDRISQAIAALETLDSTENNSRDIASAPKAPVARGRRKMSPAARKRISEMMKQRWAERKKKAKA